jgi:hypothetical protein
MHIAGFIFLVGVVMAYGFRVWTVLMGVFLLAATEVIWHFVEGTSIWSALGGIALHTLALQSGYFSGLFFAYAYARRESLQTKAQVEISPTTQKSGSPTSASTGS